MTKTNHQLSSIIGWTGATALAVAYITISFLGTNPLSFFYQGLFLAGCLAMVISNALIKNWPVIAFNAFLALMVVIRLILGL